jgi:hypothetical protein
MPAIRPDEISDLVCLADKLRRPDLSLIAEDSAFDAFLPVSAELGVSPNKHGVGRVCSEDDFLAGSDEDG